VRHKNSVENNFQILPAPPFRSCVAIGSRQKIKGYPSPPTSSIGDREAAERALERNLLANKIIRLFTMQTSFSIIRTVTHNLRITAILKLPKLALCPLSAITTQSLTKGG